MRMEIQYLVSKVKATELFTRTLQGQGDVIPSCSRWQEIDYSLDGTSAIVVIAFSAHWINTYSDFHASADGVLPLCICTFGTE